MGLTRKSSTELKTKQMNNAEYEYNAGLAAQAEAEYQAETVDSLTKINVLLTGMTGRFKSVKVTFTFEANDNG